MKYILLMNATKDVFEWYSKWPKEDLQANMAFMRAFSKELKDAGESGVARPGQGRARGKERGADH
jgi:hypothetical protein